MGVKRKALGDDKAKPDKYQCMGSKAPFILEQIEMQERDLHDRLDCRPTTCHNMQTLGQNPNRPNS
uniref:Uncharacterized protein n=1 Tax=Romanomermis culicivorax TaxID=13658 RepID=A0A915KTP1_ROMCU